MSEIELSLKSPLGGLLLAADTRISGTGVTALFGRSGSGKTSLLRWIAGLTAAKQGRLAVNGEVWEDTARGIFVPPHRRGVGFVFQESALLPHLDVWGNLEYGLRRAGGGQKLEPVVASMGIGHLLRRRPQDLSGGERQRVAIARSLLLRPRILLLDEPLSALDQEGKAEIIPLLERVKRDTRIPVLYVSHAVEEVRRFADAVLFVENGRADGPFGIDALVSAPHELRRTDEN